PASSRPGAGRSHPRFQRSGGAGRPRIARSGVIYFMTTIYEIRWRRGGEDGCPRAGTIERPRGQADGQGPHTRRAARVRDAGSVDEGLEVASARGVPEPGERLLLDLANALAGDAEQGANLFERHRIAALFEAVVEANDAGLAFLES